MSWESVRTCWQGLWELGWRSLLVLWYMTDGLCILHHPPFWPSWLDNAVMASDTPIPSPKLINFVPHPYITVLSAHLSHTWFSTLSQFLAIFFYFHNICTYQPQGLSLQVPTQHTNLLSSDFIMFLRYLVVHDHIPEQSIWRKIENHLVTVYGQTQHHYLQQLPEQMPWWGKVHIGHGRDCICTAIIQHNALDKNHDASFVWVSQLVLGVIPDVTLVSWCLPLWCKHQVCWICI